MNAVKVALALIGAGITFLCLIFTLMVHANEGGYKSEKTKVNRAVEVTLTGGLWKFCLAAPAEKKCASYDFSGLRSSFRDKVKSARAFFIMDHLLCVVLIAMFTVCGFLSKKMAPIGALVVSFIHILFLMIASAVMTDAYLNDLVYGVVDLGWGSILAWLGFAISLALPFLALAIFFEGKKEGGQHAPEAQNDPKKKETSSLDQKGAENQPTQTEVQNDPNKNESSSLVEDGAEKQPTQTEVQNDPENNERSSLVEDGAEKQPTQTDVQNDPNKNERSSLVEDGAEKQPTQTEVQNDPENNDRSSLVEDGAEKQPTQPEVQNEPTKNDSSLVESGAEKQPTPSQSLENAVE